MLNAGNQTSIAIPYKKGDTAVLGKIVTDDYFGKVPAERLKVSNGLILFKADGNQRSKIGISPARGIPMAASYDAANNVLTIAQFSLPEGKTDYVNSLWEQQQHPFAGDAVNAYNDGPIEGKQMGKFGRGSFHLYILTCPELLPFPSLPVAPIATVNPSALKETEAPE